MTVPCARNGFEFPSENAGKNEMRKSVDMRGKLAAVVSLVQKQSLLCAKDFVDPFKAIYAHTIWEITKNNSCSYLTTGEMS